MVMAYSQSHQVFCSPAFCKRNRRIPCPQKGEAWILAENDLNRQTDIKIQTDRYKDRQTDRLNTQTWRSLVNRKGEKPSSDLSIMNGIKH